jgi:hypothetical protein
MLSKAGETKNATAPTLTASRQEEECWRLERLGLLAGVLTYQHDAITKIAALHDHKSTLCVNWSSWPSERKRQTIAEFWEIIFSEHTCARSGLFSAKSCSRAWLGPTQCELKGAQKRHNVCGSVLPVCTSGERRRV